MSRKDGLMTVLTDDGALCPQFENHLGCTLGMTPGDDVFRLSQTGQGVEVIPTGQKYMAQAHGLANAGLGTSQRP